MRNLLKCAIFFFAIWIHISTDVFADQSCTVTLRFNNMPASFYGDLDVLRAETGGKESLFTISLEDIEKSEPVLLWSRTVPLSFFETNQAIIATYPCTATAMQRLAVVAICKDSNKRGSCFLTEGAQMGALSREITVVGLDYAKKRPSFLGYSSNYVLSPNVYRDKTYYLAALLLRNNGRHSVGDLSELFREVQNKEHYARLPLVERFKDLSKKISSYNLVHNNGEIIVTLPYRDWARILGTQKAYK